MEATARVVDEHVDPVEGIDPRRADRVAVAHVEQFRVGVPSGLRDLLCGVREPVGVAVADRDVRTEAGERRRDRRADALRGTRHDGASTGEQHGVGRDRHRARRLASAP